MYIAWFHGKMKRGEVWIPLVVLAANVAATSLYICIKTNDSDIKDRLDVVHRTYINGVNDSDISGRYQLRRCLTDD